MANKILIGATYQTEIRGRLGVDVLTLPDADIDVRSVVGIAEAKVIANVPDYASLVDDDLIYVYTASVCLVAAILAPSMSGRIAKSKKDFDFSIENQNVNWKSRSIELVNECYSFISLISTQAGTDFTIFGVAGPTRDNEPTYYPYITDGDVTLNNG